MYIEAASDNVWMINAFSEHERNNSWLHTIPQYVHKISSLHIRM